MSSILNYPHVGIFILAWFVADLVVPALIAIAHRLQVLDRPGGHKGQARPVPFFGGIGVLIAFAVAVSSTLRFESLANFLPLASMLGGAWVVLTLGLIDDYRPINALFKLGVLFATTVVLSLFGVHLQLFPHVWQNLPNVLITLFWIVGVTSALNSIDNTDGVAAGLTAIAGVFIFLIAWGSSAADAQPWLSYLAVGLVGSCLGFLRYNFNPARIYLGDNGSFLLGYLLAVMLVFARYSENMLQVVLIPGLIMAVPIFDIVLTTYLRIRSGDVSTIKGAILHCARDHVAHLLMGLGLTKTQTTLTIYGLGILGGSAALLVRASPNPVLNLVVAGTYFGFLAALGGVLARARPLVVGDAPIVPSELTETDRAVRASRRPERAAT
ncbi:MAG: glycosyltransferase family 4 protein [Planctomycetota bacterium]